MNAENPVRESTIFVIDDDDLFSDCIAKTIKKASPNAQIKQFKNAIDAINNIDNPLPDLIFLDILLPVVDGFTFLNEIVSYPDSSKIPIILITSLNLVKFNLKLYGIKAILNKDRMKPEEVKKYVKRYTH